MTPPPPCYALARAAARLPLAVISGRAVEDVRARVGLDGVWYAGSHGFEILVLTPR